MKKDIKEKLIRHRAEARPKKILEILGYTIRQDSRQFITSSKTEDNRYFTGLENALAHIADQLERGKSYDDLTDTIEQLKQGRTHFLEALSKAMNRANLNEKRFWL